MYPLTRNSLCTLLLLFCAAPFAQASSILNGLEVSLTWYDPTVSSLYQNTVTAVVGPGVEFPQPATFPGNPAVAVDFSDTVDQITLTGEYNSAFTQTDFNGFDLGVVSPFTGFTDVTVVSSSGVWATFDPSRVTVASNGDILVNFEGLPLQTGSTVIISYEEASSSPEPASFTLIGAALISAGFLNLKRFRQKIAAIPRPSAPR